jgi:hypothetical protein
VVKVEPAPLTCPAKSDRPQVEKMACVIRFEPALAGG